MTIPKPPLQLRRSGRASAAVPARENVQIPHTHKQTSLAIGTPSSQQGAIEVDDPQPSSRPYGTREANSATHPGKSAGLAPKLMSEISAAAAVKQAERQARIDEKLEEKQEIEQKEHDGEREIMELDEAELEEMSRDPFADAEPTEEDNGNVRSVPSTGPDDTGFEVESVDANTANHSVDHTPTIQSTQKTQPTPRKSRKELEGHKQSTDARKDQPSTPATQRKRKADPPASVTAKKAKNSKNSTSVAAAQLRKNRVGLDKQWEKGQKTRMTPSRQQSKAAREKEPLGGMVDGDVVAERPRDGEGARRTKSGPKVLARVENVNDNTDEEDDADRDFDLDDDDDALNGTTAANARSSKSTQRTLSFEDLPSWLQLHYTRNIESTLIAHVGTLDNPWKLDYELNEPVRTFGDVLNQVYSALCEDVGMPSTVISNTDIVWRYTKQRLYDWRRNFFKYARTLVKKEIQDRFAPNAHKKREINTLLMDRRDKIAAYVKDHLVKGKWIYEHPAENPKESTGLLNSPYILKLIAVHLARVEGSLMLEPAPPAGALALVATAGRHAYREWETGVFMRCEITEEKCTNVTQKYRQQVVESVCGERAYRFERILSRARPFVTGSMRQARLSVTNGELEAADEDVTFEAVDRSSPIPSDN